jgi:hypothetical protein
LHSLEFEGPPTGTSAVISRLRDYGVIGKIYRSPTDSRAAYGQSVQD